MRIPSLENNQPLIDIGFKIHDKKGKFIDVTLPSGWTLEPDKSSEESFINRIYDADGCLRVETMEKKAVGFYNCAVVRRYDSNRTLGKSWFMPVVIDNKTGRVLFETQKVKKLIPPIEPSVLGQFNETLAHCSSKCSDFLQENYPDHNNPVSYW